MATAIQMTGADIAQAEGYTGDGVRVAVMDTGIDVDHPELGGDGNAAAPHSFPNSRIVGGWDFVGDDYNADPESAGYDPVPQPDSLPDDYNGHGTHVAVIVGADKASGPDGALGVAPRVSVTYDLSHVEAIGTGPETFPPPSFWLPETQVVFSANSVAVPAHGTATVSVTITADPNDDNIPAGGLYGGYLVLTDASDADSVFRVPYAGYKGDYQSIVAIPTAPVIGKLNGPPFIKAQQTYVQAAAGHHWTLQSPDEIPNVLVHFDHQVRHLELQVVDAATGQPVHPVFSTVLERDFVARNGLRPPAGGPYNTDPNTDDVTAFPWDATRMQDNGAGTPHHRKVVPDGSYKIVVKALKAGGDPNNPAHWETWTTPTIIVDRP